jgi:hypothetical protein
MATIVNNPGEPRESSAGWAVAVIILLIVIAVGAVWFMRYRGAPAQNPGANIQVNLPTGGSNTGGSDAGGAGGGASAPAPTQTQ